MSVLVAYNQEPMQWAEQHFGDVELGDLRRNQRAVTIAAAMAANPDRAIPQLFMQSYDVKATYTFFQHPDTTPDDLQAVHRHLVLQQLQQPGRYLLIEDTTELSWSGNQAIDGLAPIGNGAQGLQGFHLHSVLAVRWVAPASPTPPVVGREAVEVIGLADQQYHLRQPRPADEPKNHSQAMKRRARESQLWEMASERLGEAPQEAAVEWLRICDRAADIYEMMHSCQRLQHGYVIRAAQDRVVTDAVGRQSLGRLFATLRQQPSLGVWQLPLRGRCGQAARTATLQVSARALWLRAPQRPGKAMGYLPPLACTGVRVWEDNSGAGDEALEWFLLTQLPVENFEQALTIALLYSSRWLIEDFHKALKSGTKAEALQLTSAEGLFAAIAIKSVVALRLLELRERLRLEPMAEAHESGLSAFELEILSAGVKHPLKTVKDVALAIGRLGGHLNRQGDGMPGWQTLFRGMAKLNDLVDGARLALKLKKFG